MIFAAVHGMPWQFILCGVIWSLALGFAAGNYACSLVHRLPRGRLLLDKTPYCGNCGTLLKTVDLFPVVSALLLKHRCRYCGQPFPTSHTWTEILVGLLFVLSYLRFGYGQEYVLVVGLGVFLITLAAIEANEKTVMAKVLVPTLVFGMIYRTLADGEIYGFLQGGGAGLIVGLIVAHKQVKRVGHIYSLPTLAMLTAAGGICVGIHAFLPFIVLFALLGLTSRITKNVPITVPFGLSVIIPILYYI